MENVSKNGLHKPPAKGLEWGSILEKTKEIDGYGPQIVVNILGNHLPRGAYQDCKQDK